MMYALIVRLRHNIIQTGIRMISLSYSRIPLEDIARKLKLDSAIDAEYIVAKVKCKPLLYLFGVVLTESTLRLGCCWMRMMSR